MLNLAANALKVGVISDMHTNLAYNSKATSDNKCRGSSDFNTAEAPIARIGCDPSSTLIDYML